MGRALSFPPGTARLVAGTAPTGELADLRALEADGMALALLVLPAAVEDSLYRFNNLPARLAALYAGVDPLDPDEDLLEEAEEEALALVSQAHLLDDVIDAVYEGLAPLPDRLIVRRPGEETGAAAVGRRGALLAMKALVQRDWTAEGVMLRLERHASVAVDAREFIVQPQEAALDTGLTRRAAGVLGRQATVLAWRGGVSAVR